MAFYSSIAAYAVEPVQATLHVPLSQYVYLLLSYHIIWHFTAVLLYMQLHLYKLL